MLSPSELNISRTNPVVEEEKENLAKNAVDTLVPPELMQRIYQAQKDFDVPGFHLFVALQDEQLGASYPNVRLLGVEDQPWEPLLPLGSNTQLFTIVALGKILRANDLDFDTPIKRVLPEFELATPGDAERWTPSDICSHVTGMPRYEQIWTKGLTSHELVKRFKDLRPTLPLRARSQYCEVTWAILDVMIERLSGVSFQDYVINEVLLPLQMRQTTFAHDSLVSPGQCTKVDQDGEKVKFPIMYQAHQCPAYSAAGGLLTNGRDLLKWLQALPSFPEWDLISQTHSKAAFKFPEHPRPTSTHALARSNTTQQSDIKTIERVGAAEGYTDLLLVAPHLGVSFAVLTNAIEPDLENGFVAWLRSTLLDHFADLLAHDGKSELQKAGTEYLKKRIANHASIKATSDEVIEGTFVAPGFLTWHLDEENNVDARPHCLDIPSLFDLHATRRPLFTSVGEGKFEGCFELTLRDSGEVLYGDRFSARLEGDKLLVFDLSGSQEAREPDDVPITFYRVYWTSASHESLNLIWGIPSATVFCVHVKGMTGVEIANAASLLRHDRLTGVELPATLQQEHPSHLLKTGHMPVQVERAFVVRDHPESPAVHCSTVQVASGVQYATWFGGTKEGHADVKIWFSKRVHGQWSGARVIAGGGVVHWNPVCFLPDPINAPETLHVFYKTGTPIPIWRTYWITSTDGGEGWSTPKELVRGDVGSGGRGPQKNPPIVLSNGDWICGASREVTLEGGMGKWDAFADIAPSPRNGGDGGEICVQGDKWLRSDFIELPRDRGVEGGSFPGEGIIQPSLWESRVKPGRVHMFMRSSVGRIVRSDSEDFGRTWTPGYITELPNNNSGQCVTRMRDGRLVVALNDVYTNWGPRTPLICKISKDDGRTWENWCTLEDQPPPEGFRKVVALETGIVNDGVSEFSYPTLTPTAENDDVGVWISYTWQRRGIVVARITDSES